MDLDLVYLSVLILSWYCDEHWVVFLLGDIDRLIANLKFNTALFHSHSARSHYRVDSLDFVLKTEFLLSPQESLRIKEGAFVNQEGGAGNRKVNSNNDILLLLHYLS